MPADFFQQPILNSHNERPGRHWELDGSCAAGGSQGKLFLDHLLKSDQEANPELLRLALKLATGAHVGWQGGCRTDWGHTRERTCAPQLALHLERMDLLQEVMITAVPAGLVAAASIADWEQEPMSLATEEGVG